MKTFGEKLKSRKFLAALAGVITGLAVVFGLDEGVITAVAGAVTGLASVVAYIVTEGRIDAAAVYKAAQSIQEAQDAMEGAE